jgi:hypothetical protein
METDFAALVHRNRSLLVEAEAARARSRRLRSRPRTRAEEWGHHPSQHWPRAWSSVLEGHLKPDQIRWEPPPEPTGPLL